MALPQGINFRATLGGATDGTNEDPELLNGGTDYPRTSAQGNTVGWETADFVSRDRNSGNDRRLVGFNGSNNNTTCNFRIDLPASGNYNVRLAAGDASYTSAVIVDLLDTNTLLAHLSTGSTSAANNFKDATNTEYSAANWPGSNTAKAVTFSTTICRFSVIGSGSALSSIAHAYIESAGGGGGPVAHFLSTLGVGG